MRRGRDPCPPFYKDVFSGGIVLDGRYSAAEDDALGVFVVVGKFKAIVDESLPPDNPASVDLIINVVRDFGLVETTLTKDRLIAWAKEYVQLMKDRMADRETLSRFLLRFAHLVRTVSARFRSFRLFQPPGENGKSLIFCTFQDDDVKPVFWYLKSSLQVQE